MTSALTLQGEKFKMWLSNNEHYLKTNSALSSLLSRLYRSSSLTGFAFCRIFDDQTIFAMSSGFGVLKHLFEKKMPIASHMPAEELKSRYWHKVSDQGPGQGLLQELNESFKICGILDYVERHHGYIDQYSFGVDERQNLCDNSLIENLRIGKNFVHEFKNIESSFLVKKNDLPIVSLPHEMAPNFKGLSLYVANPSHLPSSRGNEDMKSRRDSKIEKVSRISPLIRFQQELKYLVENYQGSLFSPRERDCLVLLLQGFTNKEIAVELGLARRTVDFYIENIKQKTEVSTRSQLRDRLLG